MYSLYVVYVPRDLVKRGVSTVENETLRNPDYNFSSSSSSLPPPPPSPSSSSLMFVECCFVLFLSFSRMKNNEI